MKPYSRYLVLLFICLIAVTPVEASDSSVSEGDVMDYIKELRPHLQPFERVNLVKKFSQESNTVGKRFGNIKRVLNFNGMSFSGDDMVRTKLTLASMQNTNLSQTNFTQADLIHVDFTGADLRGANFTEADLSNAVFKDAKIDNAIFNNSNLFQAVFDEAIITDKTKLTELMARTNAYVEQKRTPLKGYYSK
jgi:uncharacterized protein YjbI with pentapeptide repeats